MNNFDLKKYLVENKLTTNSKIVESKDLKEGFPYSTYATLGQRNYNKSNSIPAGKMGTGDEEKAKEEALYNKLLELTDELKKEEGEIAEKALNPGGGGMEELEKLKIKPYKDFLYYLKKKSPELKNLNSLYKSVQSQVNLLKDEIMNLKGKRTPFKETAEKIKTKVPAYGEKSKEIKKFLEDFDKESNKKGNWFTNLFKE